MHGKIVLIGAGNMGFHLGQQVYKCEVGLIQIYSRTRKKAEALSALTGDTPFTAHLDEIRLDADLYIVAIRDDAISEVAEALKHLGKAGKLIVHTSGVTPSGVFAPWFSRFGAFYPFQSFSIDRELVFSDIPICYYANNTKDNQFLKTIGLALGCKTYPINDKERAILHVNGVFVNNFTNYLYQISWDITKQEGIPFDLLRPLILETAQKVMLHPPEDMQTGPAIRGDKKSMKRHLDYLEKWPGLKEVYELLSEGISKKKI
jgi:predicted short-subunit dehydrogenase-like oxidoreductase (DUF2520 family)